MRHHNYYHRVALILFLQDILFYFPRYLWCSWEDGLMETLAENLKNHKLTDNEKRISIDYLVTYLRARKYEQEQYATRFFLCELLYFSNVIVHFFTNFFLGVEFLSYGTVFFKGKGQTVFPEWAHCKFPISSNTSVDLRCYLSLNENIIWFFGILWAWFVILAIMSAWSIIYRLGTISSQFRLFFLRFEVPLAPLARTDLECFAS